MLSQEQHAMRGRACRDRAIEHEGQKAEPQGLHALGRMVERTGQRLGLFRVRRSVATAATRPQLV